MLTRSFIRKEKIASLGTTKHSFPIHPSGEHRSRHELICQHITQGNQSIRLAPDPFSAGSAEP